MQNPFDPGYYESEELRSFGFKAVGENVLIARNCTIIGLENIEIGGHVRIDGGTHIIAASGSVLLGSYIHIGGGCHLSARGGIEMASYSGLSQGAKIYSASDDYSGRHMTNPTVPEQYTGVRVAPVALGRHAIVGAGSVILPGCHVGEGVAVGALSVVTRPLDAWGVYAGTPACRIADRRRDLLALEAQMLERVRDQAA
jgi:galactoside O-acetyltransferase